MRTILCFGDSNTHGTPPMRVLGETNRYAPDVRWPGVLAARLGPDWTIIEEGHPGRTTVHDDPIEGAHKNGFPALLAALETHRPVDIVILMLGTNDLKNRFSLTARDIAASVGKLVLTIKASTAGSHGAAPQVMIVAPPPILETGLLTGFFKGGAAKSVEFAECYRDVAERNECAFFDAGSVIDSSPVDGIHFEQEMHPMLGNAVADYFENNPIG